MAKIVQNVAPALWKLDPRQLLHGITYYNQKNSFYFSLKINQAKQEKSHPEINDFVYVIKNMTFLSVFGHNFFAICIFRGNTQTT